MRDDDRSIGSLLNRREALRVLGAGGAWLLAGCSSAQSTAGAQPRSAATDTAAICVVRPEQTEGPYFVDEHLQRSDLRSDSGGGAPCAGLPLALTLRFARVAGGSCTPLPGATVDLWHCDADGRYSDVDDPRFSTRGRTFLRGYQVSDAAGEVRFTTIYPGWYPGRTVHIHVKVRAPRPGGGTSEFTSQLYFDDALSDRVFAKAPYAARGQRRGRNQDDGIYRDGGDQLLVPVAELGERCTAAFGFGLASG